MASIILVALLSLWAGGFVGWWFGFTDGVKSGSDAGWNLGRTHGNLEAENRELESKRA